MDWQGRPQTSRLMKRWMKCSSGLQTPGIARKNLASKEASYMFGATWAQWFGRGTTCRSPAEGNANARWFGRGVALLRPYEDQHRVFYGGTAAPSFHSVLRSSS